jgi:hypothetical protein
MRVFLDDDPIELSPSPAQTLGAVVQRLQADRCSTGQIITRVRCDGQDISSRQMDTAFDRAVATVERLDVYTGSPAELVRNAMEEATSALEGVEESHEQIASFLNRGDAQEGIRLLGEGVQTWQQVHEALRKSIRMLELDPDEIQADGRSLPEVLARPTELLKDVRTSLESRDYVMLADILRYEFHEVVTQWQQLIDEVRGEALSRIAAKPGDPPRP